MKLLKKWFLINDKIRFVIIGGLNALISYTIFILFIVAFTKQHYQLCVALQWFFSSFISYLNQKFLVFNTVGNYIKEYLKCCFSWVISYLLNVVILEILMRLYLKNVYISQFLSLLIVSIATYILFKYFAFGNKKTNKHN